MAAASAQYAELFQAAVMQSGNCESPFTGFSTLARALATGSSYLSKVQQEAAGNSKLIKALEKQGIDASDVVAVARALPVKHVWLNKLGTEVEIIRKRDLAAWGFKSMVIDPVSKLLHAESLLPAGAEGLSNLAPPLPLALPWQPVIDGHPDSLPNMPLYLMEHPASPSPLAGKAVMIGYNKDEGTMFLPGVLMAYFNDIDPLKPQETHVKKMLAEVVGDLGPASDDSQEERDAQCASTANRLYDDYGGAVNGGGGASPYAVATQAIGDFSFGCPAFRAARALENADARAYVYTFEYNPGWPNNAALGVHHMVDLFFTFNMGGLPSLAKGLLSGDTPEVARLMQHLVATLIDTTAAAWPASGEGDGNQPKVVVSTHKSLSNREQVSALTAKAGERSSSSPLLRRIDLLHYFGYRDAVQGSIHEVARIVGVKSNKETDRVERLLAVPVEKHMVGQREIDGMEDTLHCASWAAALQHLDGDGLLKSYAPHEADTQSESDARSELVESAAL